MTMKKLLQQVLSCDEHKQAVGLVYRRPDGNGFFLRCWKESIRSQWLDGNFKEHQVGIQRAPSHIHSHKERDTLVAW